MFDLLQAYGVERVFCSPGSRNASLLMELDARDDLQKEVVIDERTAAFVALGYAMVSRQPVALVCTSGTALLNYGPALAEAFYHNIPLIVISADRPVEWIDQDDSQTIRQPGVFSNFSLGCYDIDACRTDDNYIGFVNRMVNEGLIRSVVKKRGPMHFNIHLPGTPFTPDDLPSRARKFELTLSEGKLSLQNLKRLVEDAKYKRILIVAGFMPPSHRLQKGMALLQSLPNVKILAETLSNLHLEPSCYDIDHLLFNCSERECEDLRPDILISFGGALVSRRLKEFLRKVKPSQNWTVGTRDNIVDCFLSLTEIIDTEPENFIPYFARRLMSAQNWEKGVAPHYKEQWDRYKKPVGTLDELPWSDLAATRYILDSLPSSVNLFLSNGTSVRYAQLAYSRVPHASFGNRGVSGIEGSTSTAIGGALAYPGMTCLITGDMSFHYDISALSLPFVPDNFKIIILSNSGGDIFRFIKSTCGLNIRDQYLCADPEVPIQDLCITYGWWYYVANDMESLKEIFDIFMDVTIAPCILHLDTSKTDNAQILRDYLGIK